MKNKDYEGYCEADLVIIDITNEDKVMRVCQDSITEKSSRKELLTIDITDADISEGNKGNSFSIDKRQLGFLIDYLKRSYKLMS